MSFGLGRTADGGGVVPPSSIDASTPWVAAADGNLPLLQQALQQLQLSADVADENGYTLLHAAASYSHMDILEWLVVQQKVPVNAVDADGDSALHHAATVEAAQFLLQVGQINPAHRNQEGKTALESKQEELDELMQDEDNDDEDDDFVNLKAVVEFLRNHEQKTTTDR